MEYTVLLEKQEEGGYTAQCLEVPGAISQGETEKEALKNVAEAIELVLEVVKEEAQKLSRKMEMKKVEVCA
jgi:predicted RNase H-like HicB family nuclease